MTESDPIWRDEFIETYIDLGNNYSIDNETLHVGFMLALVGQAAGKAEFLVSDNVNHVRVHPLMIQDSGSGKDPAFDFARNVADLAGFRFSDSNDLTNAGLVGTFSDGEQEPGAAEIYDIVGFREAVQLFKSSEINWNENLSENLNSILDGAPVERHLADGVINYTPTCTLVGTTYPPQHAKFDLKSMMRNGTLARFFLLFKDIDVEFRYRIGDEIIERAVNGETKFSQIGGLVATLEQIRSEVDQSTEFMFSYDPERVKREVRDVIRGNLEQYREPTRDIVEPSVVRYVEQALRIGCLMATIDECKTVVTDEHIDQALRFVEMSWKQLLQFFERYQNESGKSKKVTTREKILYLLATNGQMTKNELVSEMDVHEKTVQRNSKDLEKLGLIEPKMNGRQRVYKLP